MVQKMQVIGIKKDATRKLNNILMNAKRMETKKITPNENVGDFDSIMDELLGKPEAFRREALEYCSQMEEKENETLDDSRN